QPAPQKGGPVKKQRPKLTAVGSGDRSRSRDEAEKEAKPADQQAERPMRGPRAVPSPAESVRGADVAGKPTLQPVPAAQPERRAPEGGETPTPGPAGAGKKPKREIPPYLRVIK